jgi:ElaB/YqjD/DUF883 family membrane-anchored ribosome-binding protein
MTLQATAQELIVLEPTAHPMGQNMSLVPLEVVDMGAEEASSEEADAAPLEVCEPEAIEIVIGDLPGAPSNTPDPQAVLEVSEEDSNKKDDENEAQSKKPEKWDWSAKGATGFVAWVKERLDDIPKHSGYDTAGLERAISYLDKLDNEISRAMRMDLDGELDANKVEEVRAKIEDGINKLQDRIDKVKSSKKKPKKKRAELDPELVKEAQKITGVGGIIVTVPLLISRIARVCINGMVSAGHDIEDMFDRQVKKYKLNDREQAEVMQLLDDMGYALRRDRGYLADEGVDPGSSDNFDWAANYKG